MDIIHLLPDSVANQIAAGEVIQRPASCLKELVENSLDAGARNIQVIVQDAGRTLLQVIDDGKGMSETDARMAFERHATSKIAEAADLFSLHTMGFRGEALASVAAVAQVELLTRRQEDEAGTLLEIAGSQVLRQEPAQAPVGTNFKVKNLFYNVPARRRFLKTNTTELRNIITDFYRIVLVYPQVHFLLVSDDEILFDLPAVSLKQRIENVFGKSLKKNYAGQLVEIKADTPMVGIGGFVGKPEAASKNPQQYFFVNGRFMKHPYFHKAVMTAYAGMLPPDHNPSYFIYFSMPADAIDVNIHPTKTEIKFADEQPVWQIVQATVREALGKYNLVPSLDFNREGDIDIPAPPRNMAEVSVPQVHVNPDYNPFVAHACKAAAPVRHWETLYPDTAVPQQREEPAAPLFAAGAATLSEVYAYKDKYLLCPQENGLMVVDAHRAHVCVLYDTFLRQLRNRQGLKQQVLFPEVLDLDTADACLLLDIMDDLNAVGFDVVRLGPDSFSVNAVPANIDGAGAMQVLMNILHTVREAAGTVRGEWEHTIALSLANDTAVGCGKTLAEPERKDLLERFVALDMPAFTPDGKKVFFLLGNEEMDKRFQ